MFASAAPRISGALSKALAPRVPLTVSQWADAKRFLSQKSSSKPGRWKTDRNPPSREPMDAMSVRSPVHDVVCKFPIQFVKTELAINVIGYTMDHAPGPIMVALPGEVTFNKWIAQKLNPSIEVTPAMSEALTSTSSRDGANRREFKDFRGGQLFVEHAGSPQRLKLATIKILIVDEVDEFALNYKGGDDPIKMLDGRTSAFPSTYKRMYISTPTIAGVSRIEAMYEKSDQRRYYVPCPHCEHEQHLEWSGLHWNPELTRAWYACRECGACIDEHHKTEMIRRGRWVAENPGSPVRGYHLNCLYYQFDLGPRWLTLAIEWKEAQGDAPKLKTFINDRLAETYEDPAMRMVKQSLIADRAEPRPLRPVPNWVLAVTAGIDTQDDRLPLQILGWGRGMKSCWPIDYNELPGDPDDDDVWIALTDALLKPIEREDGAILRVEAAAQDINGHRTEAVKNYVRQRKIRRMLAIFGANNNNAPVLGKGKLVDINFRNQLDKKGVHIHSVGTVSIKHTLFRRLGADGDKERALEDRFLRFSDELSDDYFGGLTAEVFNPAKGTFEKRRGAPRNEPLDTWVYGYAAAHHPELRLHRATKADWDAREQRLLAAATRKPIVPREASITWVDAPRGDEPVQVDGISFEEGAIK